MINFEPLVSLPWAILIGVLLLAILGVQVFWILSSEVKKGRKAIKAILAVLFTVVMLGYIFQPIWEFSKPDKPALIYGQSVTKEKIKFWKDSLNVKQSHTFQKYDGRGNPIYLLGDDFSKEQLVSLNSKEVIWLADQTPNELSFLEWKGILRLGNMQSVYGSINAQDSLKISIATQGTTIEELNIEPNSRNFKFDFPISIQGRNELYLIANEDTLGSINFYAYPRKPVSYSFHFAFPDPEIRLLSQYLKKAGNHVNENIQVSRNATLRTVGSSTDSLRFLLIDPSQLQGKVVQDALSSGASVFIMNLSKADEDIRKINQALKTSFQIKQSGSEQSREIADQLTASSYEFKPHQAQKMLLENSIAIQQLGSSKVGVSMLNQTFPIQLSGDSLRYRKIWDEILNTMIPDEESSWDVKQPVFQGLNAQIEMNQLSYEWEFVKIGSDSIYLQQSLVNPFSKTAKFVATTSGWVSLADSLETFSYSTEDWTALKQAKMKADFLKSRSGSNFAERSELDETKVSDWVWYAVILLSLTLLWVEPKIRV